MSKELYEVMAEELMSRVDMPYLLFKKLQEEHEEIVFLKHFSPGMKHHYKKDKRWIENGKMLSEVMKDREEIEGIIKTQIKE